MKLNKKNLQELINYIKVNFKRVIDKNIREFENAKRFPNQAYRPHRLLKYLDFADRIYKRFDAQKIQLSSQETAVLLELSHLRDITGKYKHLKDWPSVLDSLKTKTSYEHTHLQLVAREYIELHLGYPVYFVPSPKEKNVPIPDLYMYFKNNIGIPVRTAIECYRPQGSLTTSGKKITDYIFEKSKRQLKNPSQPSLFFLLVEESDRLKIKEFIENIGKKLRNRERSNLLALLLLTLHSKIVKTISKDNIITVTRKYTIRVCKNPLYFGQAKLVVSDKLGKIEKADFSDIKPINIKLERPSKRSIEYPTIQSSNNKLKVLFTGAGIVNFLCFKCEKILAENIWCHSISNINIRCPKCSELSFVKNNILQNGINIGSCYIQYSSYNFSSDVKCRSGIQIIGVKKGQQVEYSGRR